MFQLQIFDILERNEQRLKQSKHMRFILEASTFELFSSEFYIYFFKKKKQQNKKWYKQTIENRNSHR